MRYFKASKTEIREHKRRIAVAVITAIAGIATLPAPTSLAGRPGHGPIYRTLDAVAGGIEKAIDIAAVAARGVGRRNDPTCDDGCDELTLHQLDDNSLHATPIISTPKLPESSSTEYAAPDLPSDTDSPRPMLPESAKPHAEVDETDGYLPPAPNTVAPNTVTPWKTMPLPQVDSQPLLDAPPVPQTSDEGWFDSLPPQPAPKTGGHSSPRSVPSRPSTVPKPGQLRSPSETIDTFPDPFQDDAQYRQPIKSANQPASYWEPW